MPKGPEGLGPLGDGPRPSLFAGYGRVFVFFSESFAC